MSFRMCMHAYMNACLFVALKRIYLIDSQNINDSRNVMNLTNTNAESKMSSLFGTDTASLIRLSSSTNLWSRDARDNFSSFWYHLFLYCKFLNGSISRYEHFKLQILDGKTRCHLRF